MSDLVVAITGASGAAYARRLLDVLLQTGLTVHVTVSPAARQVFQEELDTDLELRQVTADDLLGRAAAEDEANRFHYHHYQDFSAGIASGSFLTAGMVICPCSMGTLASLAGGISSNLIHRAADVHLKERRRLIVVPRETPLGTIQLQNMQRLAEAGAIILPAMPGFYRRPQSVADLVDFVVARILDQLQVPHRLMRRWGTDSESS